MFSRFAQLEDRFNYFISGYWIKYTKHLVMELILTFARVLLQALCSFVTDC